MNREIAKEQYFYPEIEEIVSQSLESLESRVILIVGQPGSGKSVFISQLYDEFKKQGLEYLTAIKAEFLKDTDSPQEIYDLFIKVRDEDNPKVLILDSLDVLAYSRRKELLEWLFYVDKLKEIKRMTVICASRSFEAEHLYPMNEQNWSEKIYIRLLPNEFIDKVLKKVNYDYKSISQNFREFLMVPLHLKIAVEIIEKGGDPKDIFDLHSLYAKLFELLSISTEEMSLLMQLSELMIKNRTIYLPYPFVGVPLLDKIKKMKERPGITGILQIDEINRHISFSHQTLIDYLSALKVISENKSISDFIFEHGQSLFLRPVIRHILGLLRILSRERLFEELEKIFLEDYAVKKIGFRLGEEKPRLHIKTAILANMASWRDPTDEEGKFLIRLFREAKDNQTLTVEFFKSKPTAGWYKVLKDIYINTTIENRDENDLAFRLIISFLTDIASDIPNEILDISLSLLKKQKGSRTLEWFLRSVSDELSEIDLKNAISEKYVEVLEQAVKNEVFRWYYDIVITCKRIAKYNPPKALNLYYDCIRKETNNEKSKVVSSNGSFIELFNEILPLIYEKIPYDTLQIVTEFFEEVLANSYTKEKRLWDYPIDLLFSQHAQRFGLHALYDWYKNKVLEACSNLNESTKGLINKLEQSKWETQKQLSMLCKLKNVNFYKDDILNYIKKILNSDLRDQSLYIQSELFIRAINKILGVIEEVERNEIINKILNLDFKDRLKTRTWIWKPLHHIPDDFKSEKVKEKLKELKEKFKFEEEYKYIPPISSSSSKFAQPKVTADELIRKSPEELYEFLIKNRDLKEIWDFENDVFYGGVEELAKEAAKVFIEDLKKHKDIINKLAEVPFNDVYISPLFYEISQKGISAEHIDWLIDLIYSVYKREKLQREIIYALEKVVKFLNDEHLDKIKDILLEFSQSKDPEADKFFEYIRQGYSNDALTEGINSIRGALVSLVISLMSKFRADTFIEILEKLSKDDTISVRAVLVTYLPYAIESIGWDKCFELFLNAFKKGAEEYADSITNFLKYVPKGKFDQIKNVLDEMWGKRKGKLGKSYALLMSIFYLRGFISEEELMEIFKDSELTDEGKEEAFNLLANQVAFEESVEKCLKIIDNLLEMDTLKGRISILFMQARPENLQKFESIINKIIKEPKIRGEALYYILEYLEKGLLFNPLKVFNLLENILSNADEDFYNSRDYIPASYSKAPLNIINTILECYPEEENRALEVLDKLIELNWNGVNEYLYALDRY